MSRTTRRPKFYIKTSETTHINHDIARAIPWCRPSKKSMDEVIAESKREFATYTRDGKWNETGRNTGFKQAAAKCIRRANARFCSTVLRGEEHENTIYPHEHLGDYLVWSFW